MVFSGHKCAAGSVDFIYSQPQLSGLREDCEYIKSTEDVVQLRIGKSKLFLSEPLMNGNKELGAGYIPMDGHVSNFAPALIVALGETTPADILKSKPDYHSNSV